MAFLPLWKESQGGGPIHVDHSMGRVNTRVEQIQMKSARSPFVEDHWVTS